MNHATRHCKVCAAITLLTFVWSMFLFPVCAIAATTTLRAGTVVTCAFSDAVDPLSVTIGQRITLTVVGAVKVAGVTVIASGAPVQAEVTQAQKQGAIGKPAVIGVRLLSVEAIDGTVVALTGVRVVEGESKQTSSLVITILCCVLGLLMKGGEASIPAGTKIDGTVVAEAQITT